MNQIEILQPDFFSITAKKDETENTFTIEVSPKEEKKIAFSPGQFNMLYAFGVGEVPISICGDPDNQNSFLHTIKVVGKATQALSRLEVGDPVGVRGPYGSSWPLEECKNRDLIIIAGGIGLAPLRSTIPFLLKNRDNYGRIAILYGARDPGDVIYKDELKLWNEKFDDHVYITVDFADERWNGNVGVVTNLISRVPFALANSVALLCGPELMLRFTIRELLDRGIPSGDIFLSMERNMKCAIGHCGRCQFVTNFICKDGPVLPFSRVEPFFGKKEI